MKNLLAKTLPFFLTLSLSFSCLAAPYQDDKPYKQPTEILNILPEPKIALQTPSFESNKHNFTTHEELIEYIDQLKKESTNLKLTVEIIGHSQEGRSIPMLIFKKGSGTKKPTVWLQAQVHGNEPAAGEGALAIAKALSSGQLGKDVLDKINVMIIPRINPDGSYYFERRTANKIMDVNRDNVKFELPETIFMHKAYNKIKAEVILDAHEYGVESSYRDIGNKGHLAYYDLLLLSSTNPNVPKEVTALADNILIANAGKAITQQGHTWHWYYVTEPSKTHPKKVLMADGVPIIGRNAYGLQPAISILVETRGIGIGKQDFKRRVTSHYITYSSMLRSVADNAQQIRETVAQARAQVVAKGNNVMDADTDKVVILSQPKPLDNFSMNLINLENNKVENIAFEGATQKEYTATLERVRPYAYVLPAAFKNLAEKLSLSGLSIQKTTSPLILNVEGYKVVENKVNPKYFEGHFRNNVKTTVSKQEVYFPTGSYLIYMGQPMANLAAMCLEPEALSSFVTFNLIAVEKGDIVPTYRLMENIQLDTVPAF